MKNPWRLFIGTYRCAVCGTRVRVYDWLPDPVLCAQHQRDEDERNKKAPPTE